MAKDFIINTPRLNSYGTRALTAGIDLTQYEKNPVLLWMHKRGYDEGHIMLGRVEDLRVEGDKLIGTPVFDEEDPEAAKIARKWEKGFLRMCSAGLEPIEYSTAPEHIVQGQTRATLIRSKLVEISIVDIGSNDDALQLYQPDGKLLLLSSGQDNDFIPLLKPEPEKENNNIILNNNRQMNEQILLMLGLPKEATDTQAMDAIRILQTNATRVETLELMNVTTLVDSAITARKAGIEKREQLITLGKKIGADELKNTLDLLHAPVKPLNLINPGAASVDKKEEYQKFSEVPGDKLELMRKEDSAQYIKLYKAEFGFAPELEK